MNLAGEKQFGLLAQDVEKVLPELVMNTVVPDQYDDKGNLIEPAFELKGVKYLGLIPILIAGVNEQQRQIVEKQAQLDDKQAQIDALNVRLEKLEASLSSSGKQGGLLPSNGKGRLFQNDPNPFGGK